MKCAIITPTPLLQKLDSEGLLGDYHLVLSNLINDDPEYAEFYRKCSDRGDFVILDNAAHEIATGESPERLLSAIEKVRPSELVLPDRLFWGQDSFELSREAATRIRSLYPDLPLMGCPQGRLLGEWMESFLAMGSIGLHSWGISKDYEIWAGGLLRLVGLVTKITPTHPVHLLGWGRQWTDLRALAKLSIRGVDSAKPMVYAIAGVDLSAIETTPKYPRRPKNFFEVPEVDLDIARKNIEFFRQWAGNSVLAMSADE